MENKCQVAISQLDEFEYPKADTLFRPSIAYPEYPFPDSVSSVSNTVYERVRNCFVLMGYDKEHYGTPEWNPLGHLIQPGDKVLIKPNLVSDTNASGYSAECLYTQPSVIAAVIDYVCIALGKQRAKSIIVGDAPMQECRFEKLIQESGLNKLVEFYHTKGIDMQLLDFRAVSTHLINGVFEYSNFEIESKIVNLGSNSEFAGNTDEQNRRMRKGANDPDDLYKHHHVGKHEYDVCQALLDCDVLIDMPKPKTHKKAGVTISLKNMVGVNVRKEYLPHHTEGDKQSGSGDAYRKKNVLKEWRALARDEVYTMSLNKQYFMARCMRFLRRGLAFVISHTTDDKYTEGHWYGNETISKTIVDLNKIVCFADRNGELKNTPQRKRIIIADMIISGEGEGPMAPTPKNVGAIAIGENPVCFDECIATIMGADITRIPTLRNARNIHGDYKYATEEDVGVIISNKPEWNEKRYYEVQAKDTCGFDPIPGWYYSFFHTADKAEK